MNGLLGESIAETFGTPVGHEMDRNAVLVQRRCQCFRGEKMTARAASRHQHRCRAGLSHHTVLPVSTILPASCARGRSRVSATSMPMP